MNGKKNNPDSPYDNTIHTRRNEYVNNRALFEEKAKFFIKKYAHPLKKGKEWVTDWDFSYQK